MFSWILLKWSLTLGEHLSTLAEGCSFCKGMQWIRAKGSRVLLGEQGLVCPAGTRRLKAGTVWWGRVFWCNPQGHVGALQPVGWVNQGRCVYSSCVLLMYTYSSRHAILSLNSSAAPHYCLQQQRKHFKHTSCCLISTITHILTNSGALSKQCVYN